MSALVAAAALVVSLDASWGRGPGAGSESLRQDAEHRIAAALVGRGCFAGVLDAGSPEADVRLEVLLEGYREEKSFDDSLAAYTQEQREPGQDMRVQASFEIFVRWRLWPRSASSPFREKRFRVLREVRPRFPGDDPTAFAREEAMDAIATETARQVCKAAGPKLEAAARGD